MAGRIVVIGANAAGMSAASQARRTDKDAEIIVLEKSPFISYGECGMPYYIGGVIEKGSRLFVLSVEDAKNKRNIDVRINNEVKRIDTSGKKLLVAEEGGKEYELSWDRLIVATGARNIRLKLPGSELSNIFRLKYFEDAERIKAFIERENPGKVAIVGAGYIGLEMAENLRHRGLEVTIIEMLPTVMGRTEKDIHDVIYEELTRNRVKVLLETTVKGYQGENGKVRKVLTDREEIEADFVLESVGIEPETSLAAEAGIMLGEKHGILVDDYMRTNVTDIFAAGDCVEVKSIVTGKPVYIPLALNANRGGKLAGGNAAKSLLGKNESEWSRFPGTLGSAVAKIFNVEVGKTGISSFDAERFRYDTVTATIRSRTKAGYWPEHPPVTVTMIGDRKTRRLLGTQIAGGDGAALRIDSAAVALYNHMTVDEVARMDLAYAPPFSPSWDPILIAAAALAKAM